MAGTTNGGKTAAQTILAKDPDFFKRIGAKGGRNGHVKGFAIMDKSAHQEASAKGGRISRKPKKVTS